MLKYLWIGYAVTTSCLLILNVGSNIMAYAQGGGTTLPHKDHEEPVVMPLWKANAVSIFCAVFWPIVFPFLIWSLRKGDLKITFKP
jgi:hypothetical protein